MCTLPDLNQYVILLSIQVIVYIQGIDVEYDEWILHHLHEAHDQEDL